jgi:hypothetical protein
MTPQAALADNHITSSIAATAPAPAAQVVYLGVVSTRPAEPILTAPEQAIDYVGAGAVLLGARDVEEASSPTHSSKSPFGI